MTAGIHEAAAERRDGLLAWLGEQANDLQAAWFAAGYDLTAVTDRFRSRRRGRGDRIHGPRGTQPGQGAGDLDGSGQGASGQGGMGWGGMGRGGSSQGGSGRDGRGQGSGAGAGRDHAADQLVTRLYAAHYRPLVRLAALLVYDVSIAQEIVQDSFVALHAACRRDGDSPLSYLRQAVVSRCRSVYPRADGGPGLLTAPGQVAGAGQPAAGEPGDPVVIQVLSELHGPQREALVLSYYAGLTDAQIGAAMGISPDQARSQVAQAMAALGAALDQAGA